MDESTNVPVTSESVVQDVPITVAGGVEAPETETEMPLEAPVEPVAESNDVGAETVASEGEVLSEGLPEAEAEAYAEEPVQEAVQSVLVKLASIVNPTYAGKNVLKATTGKNVVTGAESVFLTLDSGEVVQLTEEEALRDVTSNVA